LNTRRFYIWRQFLGAERYSDDYKLARIDESYVQLRDEIRNGSSEAEAIYDLQNEWIAMRVFGLLGKNLVRVNWRSEGF
jgi:hypothetical protein